MQPFPHHYEVGLEGGASGYGRVSIAGAPPLRVAPPPEFGGPGDAWSPEHLLLAAVDACFAFTLRAVVRAAKLEFTALDVRVEGTVDRTDGVTRYTAITVRPTITVPPGVEFDRVHQVLARAERACLVSASLSTPLLLEPDIRVASLTHV